MPRPTSLSVLVAGSAFAALAACNDATAPASAQAPNDTGAARAAAPIPISRELLAAVADADTRVVPALDAEARAPMRAALAELRVALDAGDAARGRRAVAVIRALVSGHRGAFAVRAADGAAAGDATPAVDGDDADLAAVALLVDVAASALAPAAPAAEVR